MQFTTLLRPTLKNLLYTVTAVIPVFCHSCSLSAATAPSNKLTFERYPSYYSSYSNPLTPQPTVLLRFNVPVKINQASQKIHFSNGSSPNLKIPAKLSRPSKKYALNLQPYPRDREHKENFSLSHFLLVQPLNQLPTGHRWNLVISKGFSSSDEKTKVETDLVSRLGRLRDFSLRNALTNNPYDGVHSIQLNFNKKLHQIITPETIPQYVTISPKPNSLKFHRYQSGIGITGDFRYEQKYLVTVNAGLPASDQTFCQQPSQHSLVFSPNEAFVHLPAFSTAQSLSGKKHFSVTVGNTKNTSIRIKQLEGKDLIFALRGYSTYLNRSSSIPFEMVPGRTIYKKNWQQNSVLDRSEKIELNWNSLLKTDAPGAYYLCAEADSKVRYSDAVGAQALIQLTDIGLAWKKSKQQTLLYAFSQRSGQALPNASITLFDNDALPLQQSRTDNQGLTTIDFQAPEATDRGRWLEIRFKEDRHILEIDEDMDTLSLWRFNVPYRYNDAGDTHRRTMIFTDRPVYKPGEIVHLKCLTRLTDDKQLLPPSADQTLAKLTVSDSRNRTILSRKITVSKYGSIDQDIKLPDNTLGRFRIRIDFNPSSKSTRRNRQNIFSHSFLVAEYRPNTFEIKLATKDHYQLPSKPEDKITIPVSAKYFMGKALSSARLRWHASAGTHYPRTSDFDDYIFGDSTTRSSSSISLSETLDLSSKGNGKIQLVLPPPSDSPLPLRLYLNTEITDINQQTVATNSSLMIHSSDFYLGMLLPNETLRAKEAFSLSLASIGQDGKYYPETIAAELRVERIVWNTVKVRGAGGSISHRNESQQIPVLKKKLEIVMSTHPETGTVLPSSTRLQLEESGDYLFTITARDANDRRIVTKQKVSVYGEDQNPNWSRHDGMRIDVIPDKKNYATGETAKLLVKTPITGHALVTVERKGIRRSFTRKISTQQSVIDIPIEDEDAPNVFVSVLIIRGLVDSTHQHPDTEYRLGYAQLQVDDPSAKLSIELSAPPKTVKPGQVVELSAHITDHLKQPVSNAEVTLYAVDEGVLSLTGYSNPDPSALFHAPYPLSVYTGQSISALLPENPNDLDFANKGYVIGGGGESEGGGLTRIRKNFKALAYWNGSLITDNDGKIRASFPAPDNLTEYRVIAVVNHENRFASATDKIVVQKPLTLEPSLPVFGNVGDQIDLSAILHNNTKKNLDLEVMVKLDSTAKFLNLQPAFVPTSSSGGLLPKTDELIRIQKVHIAAGKTSSLNLPIIFTGVGDAKWIWSARALNHDNLSDQIESSIPVTYPIPLLRHSHRQSLYHKNSKPSHSFNLLDAVDSDMFKGQGSIRVTFSNSRMLEALDAVDYLLKYPYGCVEQTTSSTLPWLSTQNFNQTLPALNRSPEEISDAISHGAQRLLSMQTQDGGLAYWPGSSDSVLWGSAYGGMALALAEKSGTELPADSLKALWKYLSSQLQNSGKITDAYSLSQRCLAVYTLSLAGHPETGYQDLLFEKRRQLPLEARALLALAMLESEASTSNQAHARQLLTEAQTDAPNSQVTWYGKPYTLATQLLAWTKLQPEGEQADALAGRLLKLKHGPHVWGSTYNNAWPMLAMAQHSKETSLLKSGQSFQIQFAGNKQQVKFDQSPGSQEYQFPFTAGQKNPSLEVSTKANARLYAHIEVSTQPELLPFEAQDHGFSIRRTYQQIKNDGSLTPAENLGIGDLILVTLHTTIDDKQHYLAIEDRLPSIFEAINPSFKSQTSKSARQGKWKRLYTNHTEIRKDRILFFQDYLYQGGDYVIQYLARVIAPGSATAPPAKIEAMYEPQRYGLSATQRLSASAMKAPGKAPTPIAVR